MSMLLTPERQQRIEERLARDGRVLAGDLAVLFGVSDDTIRRDLREMAAAGRCRRVYGGALPAAPDDGPFSTRRSLAAGRKAALGRALACTILPNSCLFIDAGSTNLAVAEALPEDAALTVVTNAPAIACAFLDRRGFETILLGGRLDAESGACFGAQSLGDLARFRFSALVLGVCGVDAEAGATGHGFEEAVFRAAVAARSAEVLVAATNEKIGTAAAYAILPARRIARLFVEADCAAERLAAFSAEGVAIVRAAAAGPASRGLRRPHGARRGAG